MKILLKGLLIFLIFIFISFIGFYFWGGSGSYRPSDHYKLVTFSEDTTGKKDTLSVLTFNIGYLSGLANNNPVRTSFKSNRANLNKAIDVIDNLKPDFIAFQEIDFGSHRSYYLNQFDSIGVRCRYRMGAMAVNWDKKYVPFPYWPPAVQFGRILSGQAILSEYTLSTCQAIVLPKPDSNPFYYNRFYLDRLIQTSEVQLPDDNKLLIINVHFEAFDKSTREIDSDVLIRYLNTIPARMPYILTGDFNARPPYRGVSQNNERTIRNIIDFGLVPAIGEAIYTSDPARFNTFNSGDPVEKIDYIFYNPARIRKVDALVIKEMGEISDHLPMYMKFIIEN